MNSLRRLVGQFATWVRNKLWGNSAVLSNKSTRISERAGNRSTKIQRLFYRLRSILLMFTWSRFSPVLVKRKPRQKPILQGALLLLLALMVLTSAIGYRFYNEPRLAVDTIAPQTLRAPRSVRVVDAATTEDKRRAARIGANPVLMIDQAVNQDIYQSLQRLLDEGNALRQKAGPFPFVKTSALSSTAQLYLRQASNEDWSRIMSVVDQQQSIVPALKDYASDEYVANPMDTSSYRQLVVLELQNYRRTTSLEDFVALKQVVLRARQRYGEAIAALGKQLPDEPDTLYNVTLLNLTDAEWNTTRVGARRTAERMLLQGIATGLPQSLLETAIRSHVETDVPPTGRDIAVRIISASLRPNLIQDAEQTRILAEAAAKAVPPEVVEIRQGESIVQAGERITQRDFVLLDYFNLSRRGINWSGLVGFTLLMAGSIALFATVEHFYHPGLRRRDYFLVLLLVLTSPLGIALKLPAVSLPLVGLLVGNFYGSALGMTLVTLLGIALSLGMTINSTNLIAGTIAGLLGARLAGRSRSREELATLSVLIGLIQGLVYLLLNLIMGTPGAVWYSILTTAAVQAVMGIAWGVVALGLSPYLEQVFDLITPIRLAELSNPNRPLLKRLASEAPGTFQHTVFVASLAEAAARALGCNVELVRAGTLYHDIGKMHDALGFIENQMGGPNKHDLIDNPWKSAAIIKKHVTEGIVMARKYRLPGAIRAFIPEHQGTMQIGYFFHEAQKRVQEHPHLTLSEADFRYDGPIPQSRETGIVMLADSCEAALRSLKDVSAEEALAMINRILRARWQDNQLVDSGLTRADMTVIAEIFVKVWQQFNHQRIAYPKLSSTPQASIVVGNS